MQYSVLKQHNASPFSPWHSNPSTKKQTQDQCNIVNMQHSGFAAQQNITCRFAQTYLALASPSHPRGALNQIGEIKNADDSVDRNVPGNWHQSPAQLGNTHQQNQNLARSCHTRREHTAHPVWRIASPRSTHRTAKNPLNKLLRELMAALRGAQALAYLDDISHVFHSVRLALDSLATLVQGSLRQS